MPQEDKRVDSSLWCFRSETAKLLGLSITQIHTSLTDGNKSVSTLTESFSRMAEFCASVSEISANNHSLETAKSMEKINQLSENISDSIDTAIVAFQFYDRLSQRMEHVSTALEELSTLIKDEKNLNDPLGWKELRESIKDTYTMNAEHMMYKAIMNGSSIQEALNIYKDKMNQLDHSEDIELF